MKNVVRGVTTAVDIVEALLEGPIPEAAASMPAYTPDRSPLRVFGNDAPPKGWFYTGPDPFGEFIKYQRGPKVNLTGAEDRQRYIDYFVRNGYILVFKQGNGFNVYGRDNLHIPQDGVQALEMTMGLTPNSTVNFNGRTAKASVLIYGQPDRRVTAGREVNAAAAAAAQPEPEENIEDPAKRLLKASFGMLYGDDGQFQYGNTVNTPTLRKQLAEGNAFVIKYPSGSFNVIIPERYQFKPESIRSMEKKMGLTRNSIVQWFIGEVNPSRAIHTTAAEAIYGERA